MYSACCLKRISISNVLLVKAIIKSKSCNELTKPVLEYKRTFFSFSALNDIKKARNKVINAESKFYQAQKQRRECQEKLLAVQNDLKDIHTQLPKLDRGDEKYLELVTKEYEAMQVEKSLLEKVKVCQEAENDGFATFSKLLSDSNDRQIQRMERAKNRPLWLILFGLLTGLAGTSLYRRLTSEYVDGESLAEQEHRTTLEQLTQAARTQYRQTILFLSDLQSILVDKQTKLPLKLRNEEGPVEVAIDFDGIKRKQTTIDKDFQLVKKLLEDAVNHKNPNYVQLGEEVSDFLNEMDGNNEWEIKKNALGTSLVVSGTALVGLAVVYLILRAVT